MSVPVTFASDGTVVKQPWGMITLGRQGQYSHTPLSPTKVYSAPTVAMVTANPKVRTLEHCLAIKIFDHRKFYSVPERRLTHSISVDQGHTVYHLERIAKSALYNFNNNHSREMTVFFNPLDEEQQEAYRRLVNTHLNPLLVQDGLEIDLSTAQFLIR